MSRVIFGFEWIGLMKTCVHCEITIFIAREIVPMLNRCRVIKLIRDVFLRLAWTRFKCMRWLPKSKTLSTLTDTAAFTICIRNSYTLTVTPLLTNSARALHAIVGPCGNCKTFINNKKQIFVRKKSALSRVRSKFCIFGWIICKEKVY